MNKTQLTYCVRETLKEKQEQSAAGYMTKGFYIPGKQVSSKVSALAWGQRRPHWEHPGQAKKEKSLYNIYVIIYNFDWCTVTQ